MHSSSLANTVAPAGRPSVYQPLHFGMSCVLADVKTGRKLEILDCYHELPANVPVWVTALNP